MHGSITLGRSVIRGMKSFLRADGANTAMVFALSVVGLISAAGAGVDLSRVVLAKTRLAAALDAAGLAVGASTGLDDAEIEDLAQKYFDANYPNDSIGTHSPVVVTRNGQDFSLSVTGNVPTTLLQIVDLDSFDIALSNEIKRNSNDIEVAVALDTTGSMSGTKITDLKAAATELVDIIVQDVQEPNYTKVALVPYSMGVNVGEYAEDIRGSIPGPKTVTGATKTNPVVVTAVGHGLSNGDHVYITGVTGMSALNNKAYTVANKTTDTFQLYTLTGSKVDGSGYSKYTGGGSAYCAQSGCQYQTFKNASGSWQTFQVSTCVTERTGADAYTDTPPSTSYLGRNYPHNATTNPCIGAQILPLSDNKETLKGIIDGLSAKGSTGGHIGVAWTWYMLSEKFGYLWTANSKPAPYKKERLLKVAVIMTDGLFNTSYCKGVISQDSTSGSGSAGDHINCNAPNGHAYTQAKAICAEMKKPEYGIIVYTVGFDVSSDENAKDFVTTCATDADHAKLPSTGAQLKQDFHDIAQEITQLRLSK